MKRVLVFRHVPHEGLGTLELFLKRSGIQIDYCDLFLNSPVPSNSEDYNFVISMGGSMNVDETERFPFLREERIFIERAVHSGKTPVLGICLGAQMIAHALGSRVYPGTKKEIGWYPIKLLKASQKDPLFKDIPNSNPTVFHWHGDTFELPKGSVLLASSALFPNQAFRFKKSVYALQFHVEVTSEMISDWLKHGENELRSLNPPVSKQSVIESAPKYEPALRKLAHKIYEGFFQENLIEANC